MNQWNLVIGLVKQADVVLEVIDARCPGRTRSSKLEQTVKRLEKPLIVIVNKADLVPHEFLERTVKRLEEEYPTVYVSVRERTGVLQLKSTLRKILKKDSVGIMVGYPNVGKSSVINLLARKQSASVSPTPGHTRAEQLIRIDDNFRLLDVPGIIPSDDVFSALTSTIKPGSRLATKHASKLMAEMLTAEGTNFFEMYGIELNGEDDILEELAKKFNYRKSGGVYDIERAAARILQDWNAGKLSAWWPL